MSFCKTCRVCLLCTDQCTLVCPNCGVTTRVLKPEFDYHKQPLFFCSYSRSKRFGALLSRVLLPCFEKHDAKMFRFLNTYKPYESVEDIMNRMKLSDLKDKRYCSLHTFARLYVQTYEEPLRPRDVFRLKKLVLLDFDTVEFLHRKKMPLDGKVPFFNYPWLLQKLLTLRGVLQYNPFIKQIKCKKRTAHYEQMFRENCNPSNRDCTNP